MKKTIRTILVLTMVLIFAVMSGCAHMPGGIAASTTPIGNRQYRVVGTARGTDSYILLFGFIPIKGSNSVRAAINSAKRKHAADALIEVTVDTYSQWWLILVRKVIMVEGLAIRWDHRATQH
ncbi:MAG: hypothetical protein KAH23_03160 [Kiritimatiellae bacterium]|nr:hypothetical protein [Kiritimatiellia bacterium]